VINILFKYAVITAIQILPVPLTSYSTDFTGCESAAAFLAISLSI
jgi:hypothetical protein